MTDEEFWLAVGKRFTEARVRQGYRSAESAANAGGPDGNTIRNIERGQVGYVGAATDYARLLQLSLVDIFRSVFKNEQKPLSPEAHQLVRIYEEVLVDNVESRQALIGIARALTGGRVKRQTPQPDSDPTNAST